MAGSGPGAAYVGPWPQVTSKGMAFIRKGAFLAAHPEWSIDYDRETDAYVATMSNGPGNQTIIIETSMQVLMDGLEKLYQDG
jgi:hypothetical protein